jgi:hypothetical protein
MKTTTKNKSKPFQRPDSIIAASSWETVTTTASSWETVGSTAPSTDGSIEPNMPYNETPSERAIIPSFAKENSITRAVIHDKESNDDALSKAKRSLPSIIEALKEGRLDALGYRKLRKLINTYPSTLFAGPGGEEQYNALYGALVSLLAIDEERPEVREERKSPLKNHPLYAKNAVIDMLLGLNQQYQYGEPLPGMTLVGLLVAKAQHDPDRTQLEDKIESTIVFFLRESCLEENPLPTIDALTDCLLEMQDVIVAAATAQIQSPTWNKLLGSNESPKFLQSPPESLMSHLSIEPPTPREQRLPSVMQAGLYVLTQLLDTAHARGFSLFDVQQEKLADLLTAAITTWRELFKQTVVEFATALYDIIKPEKRFRELIEDEGDLNLVYYWIGKVEGNVA